MNGRRLVLLTLALLGAPAGAETQVLVSVVSSPSNDPAVPSWKEVTGKVADELRRRRFVVRLASETLERGSADSWKKLRADTSESGAPLGVVVLLPAEKGQPTVLFVVDRITGKGLTRTLPPASDLIASSIALAAAELVDASLVELYFQHSTAPAEVPPPKDLPLPAPPSAGVRAWSVALGVGAAWPVRLSRPLDSLHLRFQYELGPRLELGLAVDVSLVGFVGSGVAGSVRLRPVMLVPSVTWWAYDGEVWRAGAAAQLGLGIVAGVASPNAGFVPGQTVSPVVTAGVGGRVQRRFGPLAVGLDLGLDLPLAAPDVQLAGQTVAQFGLAWLRGSLVVCWHLG